MRSVLVIEDDASIRRGLCDALRFAGYDVREAPDGEDGAARALRGEFDLVLLDLVLPGRGGREVLAQLRAARPTLPVILLTASGGEDDRVAGLESGADDYVTKPFSVRELLARIEAVLRRSPARPTDVRAVAFAGGVADLERREVVFDQGGRSDLAEREAALLRYLAAHRGRAVPREELLAQLCGQDGPDGGGSRSIDMQVARLREKLRDSGESPRVVLTVRGKGYMLAASP